MSSAEEIAELRGVIARLIELRRAAPGADQAELDRLAQQAGLTGDERAVLRVEGLEVADPGGAVRVRLLGGTAEDPRAGIVFYDEHGREAGALSYQGAAGEARHEIVFDPADAAASVRIFYRREDGRDSAGLELTGAAGAFLGKEGETSKLVLRDAEGRDRLRLLVEPGTEPRVEFLDESGTVTRTIS